MFRSLFVKLLFVAIGSALIVLSHYTAKERKEIDHSGRDLSVVITDKKSRVKAGRSQRKHYYLYLDLPNTDPSIHRVLVSRSEYNQHSIGEQVTIRQLPLEPQRFYPKFQSDDSIWAFGIGCGLLLVGVVLAFIPKKRTIA